MKKPKRKPPLNLAAADRERAQNLPVGCIDLCKVCDGGGKLRRIIDDVTFVRTDQPGFAMDFPSVTLHVWRLCDECGGCGTIEQ